MYHFVDLDHEQKVQRRERLDFYGGLAQISVVVPILVVQCYLLATWIQRIRQKQQDIQTPSSPYVKQARVGHGFNVSGLTANWRMFTWWCGDAVEIADVYLGTKGEVIGAAGWMLWLLVLCFVQTGDGTCFHLLIKETNVMLMTRNHRLSPHDQTLWHRGIVSTAIPLLAVDEDAILSSATLDAAVP